MFCAKKYTCREKEKKEGNVEESYEGKELVFLKNFLSLKNDQGV